MVVNLRRIKHKYLLLLFLLLLLPFSDLNHNVKVPIEKSNIQVAELEATHETFFLFEGQSLYYLANTFTGLPTLSSSENIYDYTNYLTGASVYEQKDKLYYFALIMNFFLMIFVILVIMIKLAKLEKKEGYKRKIKRNTTIDAYGTWYEKEEEIIKEDIIKYERKIENKIHKRK